MLLALAALGAGLLWIVQSSGLGISSQLFWPVAFACAGAALVWRQADSAQQKRWRAEAGGKAWLAPFVARGGWPALVRVIVGLGLVGAAFGIVIAQQSQIDQLPEVLAMTTLALAGLGRRARPVAVPLPYRAEPGTRRQGAGRCSGRHGRAPARLGAADPRPDPAAGRRSQGRAAAGPPPGAGAADLALRRRAARADAEGGVDRGRGRGGGRAGRTRSRWSWSATARPPRRFRRWSGRHARPWSTRPSTPAPTRSTCTPRSTRTRSRSSSAIAAGALTSTRSPRTGWASRAASSTAWPATAEPRLSVPRPGDGTEVRLEIKR